MMTKKSQLVLTRKAIGRVKDAGIRDELLTLADGLDIGLTDDRRVGIAKWTARAIGNIAVGLHRTLTPEVSVAILEALFEETARNAAVQRAIGLRAQKNAYCNINVSGCNSSPNSTCYTIPGQSGCGGSHLGSAAFSFSWVFKG